MDIVIISEFCGDFSKSDNDRFLYLANMLTSKSYDNDVEIVTSSFQHTTKQHRREAAEEWPFKITFIEEPGYPKNVCLKRFQSHHVWGKNVAEYVKQRKKPDVVYCAIPSLTGPNLVARYCEKESIRFVIDVQDLWPEAFQMVLNVPVISKIAFMPFKVLANGIYKRADDICAVSDTYCQRAKSVNRKVKETTTVFLGTELAAFDRYAAENPVLEKKDGEIWLAYCGTLGSSYDLTCVIDALGLLSDQRIRFIIMGDGPRKEEFEKYAETKNVKVSFVGRLQYDAMCGLLSACDITVNPIAHMAAQSIINKHADYAASGKPVINTQESDEYRNLVDKYRMGFNCRNNDSADLADKLRDLMDNIELRIKMGLNARKCAEERFDREEVYKILEGQILENRIGGYRTLVKMPGEIWLGYAGTLGTSYNLSIAFKALHMLKTRGVNNLKFIVMGDGPLKQRFEKEAEGLNVIFTGRLPYAQMCGGLKACDALINPIISSSVATIINKHADYAASGVPVINTQSDEEYRSMVDKMNMGINCRCNDCVDLAAAIIRIYDNARLKVEMGMNARSCAQNFFDRAKTYQNLCDAIRGAI